MDGSLQQIVSDLRLVSVSHSEKLQVVSDLRLISVAHSAKIQTIESTIAQLISDMNDVKYLIANQKINIDTENFNKRSNNDEFDEYDERFASKPRSKRKAQEDNNNIYSDRKRKNHNSGSNRLIEDEKQDWEDDDYFPAKSKSSGKKTSNYVPDDPADDLATMNAKDDNRRIGNHKEGTYYDPNLEHTQRVPKQLEQQLEEFSDSLEPYKKTSAAKKRNNIAENYDQGRLFDSKSDNRTRAGIQSSQDDYDLDLEAGKQYLPHSKYDAREKNY